MEPLTENIRTYVPLSAADEKVIRELFHKKVVQKDEHLLGSQVGNDSIFK
jgi:hypothetical protein